MYLVQFWLRHYINGYHINDSCTVVAKPYQLDVTLQPAISNLYSIHTERVRGREREREGETIVELWPSREADAWNHMGFETSSTSRAIPTLHDEEVYYRRTLRPANIRRSEFEAQSDYTCTPKHRVLVLFATVRKIITAFFESIFARLVCEQSPEDDLISSRDTPVISTESIWTIIKRPRSAHPWEAFICHRTTAQFIYTGSNLCGVFIRKVGRAL